MPLRFTVLPGGGPTLRKIAAELRSMDDRKVGFIFRQRLRRPAKDLQRMVRARILAIPTHDGHSGLRVRLARCVRITSRTTGPVATVAVFMDVERMPSGQYALPLTEEGLKVWRHPVFGNREVWVTQPPHPYFYPVVATIGSETRAAVEEAVQAIKDDLSGG